MSNSLRSFRVFSSEIMKAAAKIDDAEIRSLLADRKGEEYLEGGKLPSNAVPGGEKLAANYANQRAIGMGMYDHKAKTKKKGTYQKVRDYTATGMKGGLTGLGVLGAANAMRGKFKGPETAYEIGKAMKTVRRSFGAGAAVAVADKAYRHDELPGSDKTAMVAPNAGGALRSAASALSSARRTGSFNSSVVHKSGKPPRVIQLGQKFRAPGTP